MILDEQSQKQNELEQPRWEQMARNCLVEEARESIFTRPGGVAVARRREKKKERKKKVQVHLFWSDMAWRRHLKNIHHTHIRGRNLTKVLRARPGMQWWAFIRGEEVDVWLSQQQQMHHKLISLWSVAKTVKLSDGGSLAEHLPT